MARSNISVGMNRSLSPTITIIFLGLLFVALAGQSHAAEWASLKGRFVFDGDPPAPTEITADKDVEVCGKHKLVNEELVVSDGKGIANVVLFVRSKGVTVHPDLEDGSKIILTGREPGPEISI